LLLRTKKIQLNKETIQEVMVAKIPALRIFKKELKVRNDQPPFSQAEKSFDSKDR